ncbi:hypothetical protein C6N75_14695 [Streptomyces solincola]|uniref:Secreted protein n=1 Tax=Streptomyces solincola TaxID=2100817 RepID=A0A2S9PVW0_9ACTN|nr:hypothetical protein [Streptomyces solincola]PRH78477.1 hypothetical protein C6N75_14695 [Streptomyces solincola]
MADGVLEIVLGVVAAAISAGLGWFARTFLWRRRLRRKQRFLGLPAGSECLFVVNRDMGGDQRSVHRRDAYALLELSALVKDCGAEVQITAHDETRQGFGARAEFCVGGPGSNQRTAAHLASLLPGVSFSTVSEPVAERGAIAVAGQTYRMVKGEVEYVLLARLASDAHARPVFLLCGQTAISNQAAARYLAAHHEELWRRGADGSFCLLLKVVNPAAYGADMTELVADLTLAARTAPPAAAPAPAAETAAADRA